MENKFTSAVYKKSPILMQNLFVSLFGYFNKARRYSKGFWEFYRFLQNSRDWSLEKLQLYQEKMLISLVDHCYTTVPYYKELFDSLGLSSKDIKDIQDFIEKVPILEKETVYRENERLISGSISRRNLITVNTSGTTGTALKLYQPPEVFFKEYAFVWANREGFVPGQPYATFNGRSLVPPDQKKPPFWRENWIEQQTLFSQFHLNNKNLPYYIRHLEQKPFDYYQGYCSFIYQLADYILQNNIKFDHYPKAIFTSSETIYENQRKVIEEAFRTRIYDLYGSTEKIVMLNQCKYGNYHINYEYGFVEILPLEEDEEFITGEVIATGFLNFAMPLLRYRMNDIVCIAKSSVCQCGRPGPVVRRIDGRVQDLIVTGDGSIVIRLDHIFKNTSNIKESQIIQKKPGELIIKVVKRSNYSEADETKLISEVRNKLGMSTKVKIESVSEIPKTKAGKFKLVISEVDVTPFLR